MTHRLGAADLLDRTIAPGQNLFIDHSDEAAIFAKRPRLLPVGCHIAAQPIAPGVPPAPPLLAQFVAFAVLGDITQRGAKRSVGLPLPGSLISFLAFPWFIW